MRNYVSFRQPLKLASVSITSLKKLFVLTDVLKRFIYAIDTDNVCSCAAGEN